MLAPRFTLRLLSAAALSLCVVSALSEAAFAQLSFTNIYTAGTSAPGGGVFHNSIPMNADVNDNSDVAFVAPTIDGVIWRNVLFAGNGAAFSRVAGPGDPAPNGTFSDNAVFDTSISGNGTIHFYGQTTNSSEGIYAQSSSGGPIQLAEAIGTVAPGGGVFIDYQGVTNNEGGALSYVAWSRDFSNNTFRSGVFRASGGNREFVALTDMAAPGGGTFQRFNSFALSMDNAGGVAFIATPTGGSEAIFAGGDAAGLRKIAALGGTAPGGGTFSDFWNGPAIGGGQVAFAASMNNGPGGAIFLDNGNALVRVIAEGEAAPGGGVFHRLFETPSVNTAGQVVISSVLTNARGDINSGLFSYENGNLSRILGPGDPLFDSTFLSGRILRNSLTDEGRFMFWYSLASGQQGLALAGPSVAAPEPASAALIASGLLPLLLLAGRKSLRRRSRQTRDG